MILFTLVSKNAKTGPIPVSGSQENTCPTACPFSAKDGKLNGCYASYGPIAWHWKKLNNGKVGFEWNEFLAKIKTLPIGQLWRHNQFGDLAGSKNAIDIDKLKELVKANKNRKGFTYTHKPISPEYAESKTNQEAIKFANENGFTVNISCNNLDEVDEAKKINIGPTVVVVSKDCPNTVFTKAGNKVIVCPAQTKENMNCSICRLCSNAKRSVTIGFRSHGMGAKHVEKIVN